MDFIQIIDRQTDYFLYLFWRFRQGIWFEIIPKNSVTRFLFLLQWACIGLDRTWVNLELEDISHPTHHILSII